VLYSLRHISISICTSFSVQMIPRFKVVGKHLIADIEFGMANSFAADIARQYRDGYLNAVSGFARP
jgi:hypothetical protein